MSDPKPGTDRTNPKDLVGQAKVDLSLFPPAAHIHGAHAFMDGAVKYGAYNWRERQVRARVYISAAQRHLADFLDGENLAQDSGVHHLGHVIACCGIILDALETGNLIDDRPVGGAASAILDRVNAAILARQDAGKPAPRHVVADFREALADVKARLAVLPPPPEPVFGPCLCQPGMRCVFFDDCANHPESGPAPYLSPAEAASVAELAHEPDCACAPGVRCHSTFKVDCPRLVEGRDTGMPGCQDAGNNTRPCPCQKRPGAACSGEHPWCLQPSEGGE